MSSLPANRRAPGAPSTDTSIEEQEPAGRADAAIADSDGIPDSPSTLLTDQQVPPPARSKITAPLAASVEQDDELEEQTEKRPAIKVTRALDETREALQREATPEEEQGAAKKDEMPTASEQSTEPAPVEAPPSTPVEESAPQVAPERVAPVPPLRRQGLRSLPRIIAIGLLSLFLFSLLGPAIVAASYSINAYTTYSAIKAHANSGLQHLLNVKTIFSGAKSKPGNAFDARNLARMDHELLAARGDFIEVQSLLDHTTLVHTVTQYLPQYRSQVAAAHTAAQIGIDISLIGRQLVATAAVLAPKLRGPLLSESHTPLVTSSDIALIDKTFNGVLPLLNDIEVQGQHLSLDALPINAHQKEQMRQYLQMLPEVKSALSWAHGLLGAVGWLLGVDQPRTFLLQTMDRAELRATGGFTGQYGELHIQNGRLAPFSLHDISFVEYSDNSPTSGHLAPGPYRAWWPFANWGLRDSNLSADFPTSARLAIQQYKLETKNTVDGVILFTPFLIESILQAIGPLHIPRYNETITAQNLEERLHYYQLDNSGIRRTEIIEHVSDPGVARKLFTSQVAHTLMDEIRHAPPSELLSLGLSLLHAMKTKDLQVYMSNPQVEDLLKRFGYAADMDRSLTHDGLYIVQSNVSASKASQYVQTVVKDTITLDAKGGATHVMQLRLVYNQEGPVYGLDTYRDYVRVYVPPQAKFLWGDGFDTGQPLCGGPLAACPDDGVYPQQQLVCASGQYIAGATAPTLGDPYAGQWHPLNKIGPPTNFTSDEPQRAMFGGYVIVPKNCTMTVTLSWYVPPLGAAPYMLLLQRQSSTFPDVDVTILPPPGECDSLRTAGTSFHGVLSGENLALSLPVAHTPRYGRANCYPSATV